MKRFIVILMLAVFGQATVCATVFCFLDELEVISLELSSAPTMIEEEETHAEHSQEEKNSSPAFYHCQEDEDFGYLNEQRFQLLPGYTDRVFSPPEVAGA